MKPIERRKTFTTLHRVGRKRGVSVVEEADVGSGSHGSILFYSQPGVRPVRIIIVYSREISPGVQRAILKQLERQASMQSGGSAERLLTTAVLEMCRACFGASS